MPFCLLNLTNFAEKTTSTNALRWTKERLTGVFQVVRDGDATIRSRLKGECIDDGSLLVLTNNGRRQSCQLLTALDGSQRRDGDVKVFPLLLEEL